MIKVSVLYPNSPDARFDMTYYVDRHMQMVRDKMGSVLKDVNVEEGLAGGRPGDPPPFVAICHLFFDSVDAFQGAFAAHGDAILSDIPNYTNTQPTVQVSQVKF